MAPVLDSPLCNSWVGGQHITCTHFRTVVSDLHGVWGVTLIWALSKSVSVQNGSLGVCTFWTSLLTHLSPLTHIWALLSALKWGVGILGINIFASLMKKKFPKKILSLGSWGIEIWGCQCLLCRIWGAERPCLRKERPYFGLHCKWHRVRSLDLNKSPEMKRAQSQICLCLPTCKRWAWLIHRYDLVVHLG